MKENPDRKENLVEKQTFKTGVCAQEKLVNESNFQLTPPVNAEG